MQARRVAVCKTIILVIIITASGIIINTINMSTTKGTLRELARERRTCDII